MYKNVSALLGQCWKYFISSVLYGSKEFRAYFIILSAIEDAIVCCEFDPLSLLCTSFVDEHPGNWALSTGISFSTTESEATQLPLEKSWFFSSPAFHMSEILFYVFRYLQAPGLHKEEKESHFLPPEVKKTNWQIYMRDLGAPLPVVENDIPVPLCEADLETASTELHVTITRS